MTNILENESLGLSISTLESQTVHTLETTQRKSSTTVVKHFRRVRVTAGSGCVHGGFLLVTYV